MSDYTREAEMALDMVRLRRELEAMKAERDALGRLVHDKAATIMRMKDERDALSAHVEWLDGLRRNVIEAIRDDRFEDLDVSFYRDDKQPPKPTTSLARLKATARAEAMEWAAEKAAPSVAPWLKALARDYRRQAGDE